MIFARKGPISLRLTNDPDQGVVASAKPKSRVMIVRMKYSLPRSIAIVLLVCLVIGGRSSLRAQSNPSAATNEPQFPAEDLQFFEQKIRPVLEKHCVECHSEAAVESNKLKGGLRLDSRVALLRGGDSGPALVPNKPDESLLLQAMRYQSFEMPPKGRLPDHVISDFERWILKGAADPRTENSPDRISKGIDLEQGRRHWSYKPLQKVSIPNLDRPSENCRSPIDAFIRNRFQAAGLIPSNAADRVTLGRRAFFDLVGLPPSPEEIDEFLADESPDAFERLVDRLIASPHFGARWGRHWLSVARFAESVTLRGLIQPEAWRYRDYVVDTFNSDLPFSQFIIEQLAGDLLASDDLSDRQRQLIATTYLTLGNHNLEEQDKKQLRMDVVDEQLEAIGKGFLAQTIGCARCHDHKFDPIPTRDYYALAGILANVKTLEDANVSKWLEMPLPLQADHEAVFALQETSVAALQTKIDSVKTARDKLQKPTPTRVVASKSLPGIIVDDKQAKVVGDWQLSQSVQPYIDDGYLHDKNAGKGDKTITLLPELPKAGVYEVRLAYPPGENRCDAVPVTVMSAEGEKEVFVNQKIRPPIDGIFVSLGQFRFELNGQGFVIVSTEGTSGHVIVDAAQFLPLDAAETARQTASVSESGITPKPDQEEINRLTRELQSLQQEMKKLQHSGPRRPLFMSVREEPRISDTRVHIRGTVHNLGEPVPRGFLQVATFGDPDRPTLTTSGRKELGEWIASPDNPLTSRVLANRVWLWLFGAGLSRTPDNFGFTGDAPTHPELLDWLSQRLLERQWSVKTLVREVLTSETYVRSSEASSDQTARDPDNRWLSHQNRRRLDAECLLDAILTVSGDRNDELGGSTIPAGKTEDYGYLNLSNRRAVYWPVLRNSLPEIFEIFDFADPSSPTSSRTVSTVASQSLFFMNDEWVATEAQHTAQRVLAESDLDDTNRIRRLFRWTIGREPTSSEAQIARQALTQTTNNPVESWTKLTKALFASIDFRYVE